MCRILAIKNFNYAGHEEFAESFYALAEKGKTLDGDMPGHCDGWGIGWHENGKAKIYKSGRSILKEKALFFGLLKKISRANILIIHLRKSAWKNTATKANAHPFMQNNVLFAHNGTVRDYKKLLPLIPSSLKPANRALDSEVLLSFITGFLDLSLGNALKKAANHIHRNNVYSSLTCVLSDGKKLYAYRDFKKYPDYYTLYRSKCAGSILIASEKLTGNTRWKAIKNNELFIQ